MSHFWLRNIVNLFLVMYILNDNRHFLFNTHGCFLFCNVYAYGCVMSHFWLQNIVNPFFVMYTLHIHRYFVFCNVYTYGWVMSHFWFESLLTPDFHRYGMTHSYVWRDTDELHLWMGNVTLLFREIREPIQTPEYSYMGHDSFICVMWHVCMGNVTHLQWLQSIHMCGMTYSYVSRDSYDWMDNVTIMNE